MFDTLSDKLNAVFKQLKGQGKLSEKNIADGLRAVRMALLEADVHYQVVKKLVADIKERALGQEVMGSLTPGQQVVKIVNDSLTQLMGESHQGLNLAGQKPVAVMLVGLQGSGKTTTAGKLAVMLRKTGKQPYLVPADVYRPAAIDQLKKLGGQLKVPVFDATADMDPVQICQDARVAAQKAGCDTLLAGYGRTAAHRWRVDGGVVQHSFGGQTSGYPAGGRRHDRPGRGEHRQSV
jgi:signal recognition particle subunit SRP54